MAGTFEPRKKSPLSPRIRRFRTAGTAVAGRQGKQPRPGLLRQPAPLSQPLQLRPQALHLRLVRAQPGRDRKSTRLNSSHSSISYAVFCLKKKKKNTFIIFTEKKTEGKCTKP